MHNQSYGIEQVLGCSRYTAEGTVVAVYFLGANTIDLVAHVPTTYRLDSYYWHQVLH